MDDEQGLVVLLLSPCGDGLQDFGRELRERSAEVGRDAALQASDAELLFCRIAEIELDQTPRRQTAECFSGSGSAAKR